MEHEYFDISEAKFYGFKIEVDMSNIGKTDFVSLWKKVFDAPKDIELNDKQFYIGLERYNALTRKNRMFDYYAMFPSECKDKNVGSYEVQVLPAGRYIRFKNKIKTHGPDFFKEVYSYLKEKDIEVELEFDFEILPYDFDFNNEDSVLYVGLKLKNR